MSNQHSKCDDCYKTHLPEAHDRTILPSEAFGEGYVPEFNQASKGEQRTLDDILSQAFTDGASDTMWIADRHIEIFATAKKELEAIIRTEKLKLLDEVIHQSTVNLKSARAVAGWAEIRKKQLEAEL